MENKKTLEEMSSYKKEQDLNRKDFMTNYAYLNRLVHIILKYRELTSYNKFVSAIEDLISNGNITLAENREEMEAIYHLIEELMRFGNLNSDHKAEMKKLRKKFKSQLEKSVESYNIN